jgi:hypothetical protein
MRAREKLVILIIIFASVFWLLLRRVNWELMPYQFQERFFFELLISWGLTMASVPLGLWRRDE